MDLLVKPFQNVNSFLNKYQDSRTADWALMSSPFYTLGICLSYVVIVKYLGPKFMENRKPYRLENVLIAYNCFQVLFSILIFYEIGISGWFIDYSLRCQPVDYSNRPTAVRFFFVLRKKFDQVSTLHVIHHGIMPLSVWFGVKFTPGGHSTFFGFLNSFVHIIMYFYYLLSALGPSIRKYLWWKKYLTTLQMVQFVAIMVHAFQLLFTECNYPRAFVWWIGMHAVMFFFLFKEFYYEAYSKRYHLQKQTNGTTHHNGNLEQNACKLNGVQKRINGLNTTAASYYSTNGTIPNSNHFKSQ